MISYDRFCHIHLVMANYGYLFLCHGFSHDTNPITQPQAPPAPRAPSSWRQNSGVLIINRAGLTGSIWMPWMKSYRQPNHVA